VARYTIVLARSAERDLEGVPSTMEQRVEKAIDNLAENPRPPGVRKLRGTTDLWRIRVGDYRVVYRIDDSQRLVDVTHIRHRRDAYE
jgi:mRNA interferase RelE/StbE